MPLHTVSFGLQGCYLPDFMDSFDSFDYALYLYFDFSDELYETDETVVQYDCIVMHNITRLVAYNERNVVMADVHFPQCIVNAISRYDNPTQAIDTLRKLSTQFYYGDENTNLLLVKLIDETESIITALDSVDNYIVMSLYDYAQSIFNCDNMPLLWYSIDNDQFITQLRYNDVTLHKLNNDSNPIIAVYSV